MQVKQSMFRGFANTKVLKGIIAVNTAELEVFSGEVLNRRIIELNKLTTQNLFLPHLALSSQQTNNSALVSSDYYLCLSK